MHCKRDPTRATAGLRPPLLIRQSLFAGQHWRCIASATQPEPRGAYDPRSCVAVRMSADEKRFVRCTYAHLVKSGGREPAVGL